MTAKLMRFSVNKPSNTLTAIDGGSPTVVRTDGDKNAEERAAETNLLLQLQKRKESAVFDEIFRRFAPKLKSYLISLGSAQDAAEAVVQEVMVTVWTKAHLFDANKASARTWMFTLVRNRYIDVKRAEARQAKAYDQYADSGIETETSGDTQFNHAAGQQISVLLEKLPKEQAEILLMAYVEGKSHREIAEQLGVPIGTTKSRVRLAFQRLRKLMENPE
ncbi:MAG: sigma-70 family RNA polymerase sigma factor [Pseudomonadota bacterium]